MKLTITRQTFSSVLLSVSTMAVMYNIPGASATCRGCEDMQRGCAPHNGLQHSHEALKNLLHHWGKFDLYHPWQHIDNWNLDQWDLFTDMNPEKQLLVHMATLCNIMLNENWKIPELKDHYIGHGGYHRDFKEDVQTDHQHDMKDDMCVQGRSKQRHECNNEIKSKENSKNYHDDSWATQSTEGMTQWRKVARQLKDKIGQQRSSAKHQRQYEHEKESIMAMEERSRQERKQKLLRQQRAEEAEMQKRREDIERKRLQLVNLRQQSKDHTKENVQNSRLIDDSWETTDFKEMGGRSRRYHQNAGKRQTDREQSDSLHNSDDLAHDLGSPDKLSLSLSVPGYHPENIDIRTKGNQIIITGKQVCGCDENCVIREFEKSYDLPRGTDLKSLRAFHSRGTLSINGLKYKFQLKMTDTHIAVESLDQHLPPKNAHLHCNRNKPAMKLSKVDKRTGKAYVPEEIKEDRDDLSNGHYFPDDDDDVMIEVVDEFM